MEAALTLYMTPHYVDPTVTSASVANLRPTAMLFKE